MKHIKTKCNEEIGAISKYATVTQNGVAIADSDITKVVDDLFKLLKDIDEMQLKASVLRAKIMQAMKNAEILKDENGRVLVTWYKGGDRQNVDYDGLIAKYNISKEDLDKFTTIVSGGRKFSLQEE